jgi:hypothetical protein
MIDRERDETSGAQEAAQRLRAAIDRIGGNKGAIDRTGIPSRTLSAYLAGGEMKRSAVVALAKACGVNIAWLAAGEGPMEGETQSSAAGPQAPEVNEDAPARQVHASTELDLDRMAKAIEMMRMDEAMLGVPLEPRAAAQMLFTLYDHMNRY